jgi:hypothetical protein
MALPESFLFEAIQNLASDISYIYWPCDFIQDVQSLADAQDSPDLVTMAKDMVPNVYYEDKKPMIRIDQSENLYGLKQDYITKHCKIILIPSKSKKSMIKWIYTSQIRSHLRERFKLVQSWYIHMMRLKYGFDDTKFIDAILKHYVDKIDSGYTLPDFDAVLNDEVWHRIRYGVPKIADVRVEDVDWIISNYLENKSGSISDVEFYFARSTSEKLKLFRDELPIPIDLSEDDINKNAWDRCVKVSRLKLVESMKQIVKDYIVGSKEYEDVTDALNAHWQQHMNSFDLSHELREMLLETIGSNTVHNIKVLNLFTKYKLTPECEIYDRDDIPEDEIIDIKFIDCRNHSGYYLSHIPKKWFEDDYSNILLSDITEEDISYISTILEAQARLESALISEGLDLRDDSRLCQAYIMNDEGDIKDIVQTMKEMKFFFDHTKYSSFVRSLNFCHSSNSASKLAKLAALHIYKGNLPKSLCGYSIAEAEKAYVAMQDAKAREEDYYEHECPNCGSWMDDDDYCSNCGTDDE